MRTLKIENLKSHEKSFSPVRWDKWREEHILYNECGKILTNNVESFEVPWLLGNKITGKDPILEHLESEI